MKLILATPLLAKLALSVPFAPPPAVPEILEVVEEQVDAEQVCSDVWSRTCSGTNSNGDAIYGSYTCGARVQYVYDVKLGRTPTMSAAIAQVLSECPTQCQELADNQCDDYVEDNLETISEDDCSATWDATCTNIYGTYTCGERVKYDNRKFRDVLASLINTYHQCEDQCEHINRRSYNQCADFFEGKMNEEPVVADAIPVIDDDYEPVVADAEPAPLGTCQEAYDRTCTDRYGSFTCGKRVNYNIEKHGRSMTDAIAKVNSECPTECREFQNNNCDDEIAQNIASSQNEEEGNNDEDNVNENGSGSL